MASRPVASRVSFQERSGRRDEKLARDDFADGLAGFVNGNLENSFGFFRPFLESVVLPNNALFAILVAWGELLVGLAMVLGVATRYAGFAGAFMLANFWFAKGQSIFNGQNHDAIWVAIFLVLALVPAGKDFGLDRILAKRFSFLK